MAQMEQIREALAKAEGKVKRLSAQLEGAVAERDELLTAVRVIERLFEAKSPSSTAAAQSDNGQLIYSYVGVGRQNAGAPKDIIDALRAAGHDLNDDLVRTQLWRMAKRNELRKGDGRYWRPQDSDAPFEDAAPNDEAPGGDPGASEEFGRVAELEVPGRSEQHPFRKGENVGSSPTPPSPPQPKGDAWGWDDDSDIPF